MTDDLARVLADIDTLLPPGAPSNPHHDGIGTEDWERGAMRWQPADHDTHPDAAAPPEPGDDDYVAGWQVAFAAYERERDAALSGQAAGDADRGSADVPGTRGRPVGEPDRGSLGLFQQQPPRWPFIWQTTSIPPVGQGVPDRVGVVIERSGWHLLTWPGLESAARAAAENESVAYRASLEQLGLTAQHTTSNLQHLRDRIDQAQAAIDARRYRNTGPANPRGIDGRARRHQHPHRAAADNARPATQGAATQGEAVQAWLQSGPRFIVGRGPHPDVVWSDEPWDVGL